MKKAVLLFSLLLALLTVLDAQVSSGVFALVMSLLLAAAGILGYFVPLASALIFVITGLAGIIASIAQQTTLYIWGFCFLLAFATYFLENKGARMQRIARLEALKALRLSFHPNSWASLKYIMLRKK